MENRFFTQKTIVWWHNFTHMEREQLIKCSSCKRKQLKAYLWDYQKCEKCNSYIYDNRW